MPLRGVAPFTLLYSSWVEVTNVVLPNTAQPYENQNSALTGGIMENIVRRKLYWRQPQKG